MCDLETSRIGAPYIYDISNLRVKAPLAHQFHSLGSPTCFSGDVIAALINVHFATDARAH